MAKSFLNASSVVAIVAGLSAGLLLANYLRDTGNDIEIHELGAAVELSGYIPKQLPPITLPDLYEQSRSVSEWYGRPLIVNFWATWCAPCRREMPLLQLTHEMASESDPMVIGIAVDRLEDVRSYIAESGYTYPILTGQQEALDITELFGFDFLGLPFTVFTTDMGEILAVHVGELHAEQLSQYLTAYKLLINKEIDTAEAARQMSAVAIGTPTG